MKQYTLLWVTNKNINLVEMRVFNNLDSLRDYKNYYLEDLKDGELTQVDKEGYIWFIEN